MKAFTKSLIIASLLLVITGSSFTASAENTDVFIENSDSQNITAISKETEDLPSMSETAEPLSNTDAYLDTEYWTILKSSTTVLPYSPVVINQSYNRGVIWVKVEDKNGNLIGSPKLISPGDSATMDMINAFTGYTISAKAYTLPGSYMITIQ